MPTNLDRSVFLGANVIGVVDDPCRQPEQSLLNRLQGF